MSWHAFRNNRGMKNCSSINMNESLNRAFIEAMRMMNEYTTKKESALITEVSNDETKVIVSGAVREELLH